MTILSKVLVGASLVAVTAVVAGIAIVAISCKTTPAGKAFTASGAERDPGEILAIGDKAQDFTANDQDGKVIKLGDYLGNKSVVMIFYPGDETPGCTSQLCAARDAFDLYAKADAVVLGVNPAGEESHKKFAEKQKYQFSLLADTDGSIIRNYGARGLAGVVNRTVYVIGKDGTIVFAERGMPATKTILAAIEKANATGG